MLHARASTQNPEHVYPQLVSNRRHAMRGVPRQETKHSAHSIACGIACDLHHTWNHIMSAFVRIVVPGKN